MGKSKGFDLDLAYGESRENVLAQALGNESKIEVKSDRQAVKTGNIYVEYESRGKPSGISTTTAEWWAYEVLPAVFVLMPTSRLRYLVDEQRKVRFVRGGDNNSSKGVLLKVASLTAPLEVEKVEIE